MSSVSYSFGEINGHLIGIAMKELVARAIRAIRPQRLTFQTVEKKSLKDETDYVTSADNAAQARYLKSLQECFPGFGIIAEEDNFRIRCTHPTLDVTFSVDGLDGTKAWVRKSSRGIGTMIALRVGGEIVAAYVGDVMTQELFGFRPGSEKVHCINELGQAERLEVIPGRSLVNQNVVLRARPDEYPPLMSVAVGNPKTGGLFKDIEIEGGSIGICFSRLWKGEVGGIMLKPSFDTPWDQWPVLGICRKMGFVWLRPTLTGFSFEEYDPGVGMEVVKREHPVLVIHKSRLIELRQWEAKR